MAKKLGKINIIDVEATCWENDEERKNQPNEIIEIGIAILDVASLTIEKNDSIFVRPEKSKVSPYCENLTHISQQVVDNLGIPFDEACEKLRTQYQTKKYPWTSWGDYDRHQFQKQCAKKYLSWSMVDDRGPQDIRLVQELEKPEYPFGARHINIKTLFGLFMNLEKEVGVPSALQKLNMKFDGTHHRGMDDAYNIARIFTRILEDR